MSVDEIIKYVSEINGDYIPDEDLKYLSDDCIFEIFEYSKKIISLAKENISTNKMKEENKKMQTQTRANDFRNFANILNKLCGGVFHENNNLYVKIYEQGGIYEGCAYYHGSRHHVKEELNAGRYYVNIKIYHQTPKNGYCEKRTIMNIAVDIRQHLDVGHNKVYFESPDFYRPGMCEIMCDMEYFRKCGISDLKNPLIAMVMYVRERFPETNFRNDIISEVERNVVKFINKYQKEENPDIPDDELFIEECFEDIE